MAPTRPGHPSLLLGHAAVAMLTLSAIHVVHPSTPVRQWTAAEQIAGTSTPTPRRLPARRRSERALID